MGALRTMIVAALLLLGAFVVPVQAAVPEYDYVTVSDGTEIAVSVWYPPGFSKTDSKRWPALFEMDGYGGARNVNDTQFAGKTKDFVVVFASIRGTGCSGGTFDLFSEQSARDGYDIIERWLVKQPWSNGRVGITGHSYSGLTGFLVAETRPPHVRALAVSGLIDDFYRGILYPGGIPNAGFPVVWGGVARQAQELEANAQPTASEDRCRNNFISSGGSGYAPSPQLFLDTYTGTQATEDSWAIQRGLVRRIDQINVPTQIGHQYQDEQTGPRGGPVLWEHLPRRVPKRLVLSNGRHVPNDPTGTKDDWLRCWVIEDGRGCGDVTDRKKRVLMFFDSLRGGPAGQQRAEPYTASNFPAPETDWRRWKLDARTYASPGTDHRVTLNTGLVMSEDQGVGGATFPADTPTQATWTLPFAHDTALSGPIDMTLWATITAPDTDFFVDVLDRDPKTGELLYLQRGMLRASFRRLDARQSDRVARGMHRGEIWRPYHPFVDPEPVTIGSPDRYEIEIYPLGHIFRAGHELVLQLHAPPPNDPLSINTYPDEQAPAVVKVLQDDQHSSSVLLPFLPTVPVTWPKAPVCGEAAGELCMKAPG